MVMSSSEVEKMYGVATLAHKTAVTDLLRAERFSVAVQTGVLPVSVSFSHVQLISAMEMVLMQCAAFQREYGKGFMSSLIETLQGPEFAQVVASSDDEVR